AKTAGQKTAAEKDGHPEKVALAACECKDAAGGCKPADAKQIEAAQRKLLAAEGRFKSAKTAAQKTAAEKDVHTEKVALAALECREEAGGGGPADGKQSEAAQRKLQ